MSQWCTLSIGGIDTLADELADRGEQLCFGYDSTLAHDDFGTPAGEDARVQFGYIGTLAHADPDVPYQPPTYDDARACAAGLA